MKIIADFAHHKVASNLLMLLMIVAGVFAINRINIQFFPSFELDRISVSVSWPGASAEDIEQGLTIPLEQNLKGIEYLKHMSSTSAQSISSIQLEFEQEADLLLALDKVKQKVAEFKNLPTDAEKPIVESIVRYESIAKIMIEGNLSIREFRQLTEQYEKELLHRGIDKVTISGLPEEEINISIPTAKLMQY
ncbi:MAG: efflux RND transporter permease subunit, partial [Saprospiraceae bacterium]